MPGNRGGLRARRASVRGAGLTEYLIVLAGISIAAAATFSAFGDTMRHQLAAAALELAGMDSSDAIAGAAASAGRASNAAAAGGAFFGRDGSTGGGGVGGGSGGGLAPGLPFQPPGSGGGGDGGDGGSGPPPAMCPAGNGSGPQAPSVPCDSEMTLSAEGEAWLKEVEKLALQPYDDQKGITGEPITEWVEGATIGYGHLILEYQWEIYRDGITKDEADALFQIDAAPYVKAVNDAITASVERHEFDAMVILTYNIGEEGFAGSSVAKLVNDPFAKTSYASLEDAWRAWNKSQGKVNRGLINRRAAEWDMYSQGIYRYW